MSQSQKQRRQAAPSRGAECEIEAPSESETRLADIAGRKQVEERLIESERRFRAAEEALREADRRKNEFLAMLSHELRNPLAAIWQAVEILNLREPADPRLQNARDVIDRQLQRMVRLMEDLLDVSRITRGTLELRKERISLDAVLDQALETSRPHIERADHELILSLPSPPVYLDADPVRLAQVFSNLLNNAARYTDRAGSIQLTAAREGSDLRVTVRDSGIGIPPEYLPRLFEPFSQVERAPDRARGGLGIGLALVRELVRLHGGSVSAHRDGPGKGSEFAVRLPLLP